METIVANVTGPAKEASLMGREYLVRPMTLIVPGVLNGSKGKLYYPPEECAADPMAWNGMPLVAYHPVNEKKEHVSARHPDILNKFGLGFAFNTGFGDTLAAEAWFDKALVNAYDKNLSADAKIMPRVMAGDPISLSTGLFTTDEPTPGKCPRTNADYDAVARDYRPDHVAVLPDEPGACDVKDGCGINVTVANSLSKSVLTPALADLEKLPGAMPGYGQVYYKDSSVWYVGGDGDEDGFHKKVEALFVKVPGVTRFIYESEGFPPRDEGWILVNQKPITNQKTGGPKMPLDKKQLVAYLTTNCKCWKNKAKTLNAMDEDTLKGLRRSYIFGKVMKKAGEVGVNSLVANGTKNAEGEGEVAGVPTAEMADLFGITTDPAKDPAGYIKELKAALQAALDHLGGSEEETTETEETPADPEPAVMSDADPEHPAGNRKGVKAKSKTAGNVNGPSFDELLAKASPQTRNAFKAGINAEKRECHRLGTLLVQIAANSDKDRKALIMAKLKTNPDSETLNELLTLVGGVSDGIAANGYPNGVPSYLGAGGGLATTNANDEYDKTDVMPSIYDGDDDDEEAA